MINLFAVRQSRNKVSNSDNDTLAHQLLEMGKEVIKTAIKILLALKTAVWFLRRSDLHLVNAVSRV